MWFILKSFLASISTEEKENLNTIIIHHQNIENVLRTERSVSKIVIHENLQFEKAIQKFYYILFFSFSNYEVKPNQQHGKLTVIWESYCTERKYWILFTKWVNDGIIFNVKVYHAIIILIAKNFPRKIIEKSNFRKNNHFWNSLTSAFTIH